MLQNAATNGFSCPMCRSAMATEPELSDDEDDYEEYSDDEDDYEEDYDDNALTSFRMFHQQLAGEDVEEEQPVEEPLVQDLEAEIKPNAAYIAAKLVKPRFNNGRYGKMFELVEHEEYEADIEINDSCSNRMFGKFRQIISTYKREQQQQQEELAAEVRHQSSRLRAREDVEDLFGQLQNRYALLDNDSEEDV